MGFTYDEIKMQAQQAASELVEIAKLHIGRANLFLFDYCLFDIEDTYVENSLELFQNLYLDKVAIGAPPDYFSKNGQRWGFKYFNPKHIFNKDGSLGKAGEALKKKYQEINNEN